jgi:PadR family transcriptional regulator AphA
VPARRRPTEPAPAPQGLAEQVCLVLITQGVGHGWAIGSLLGADGNLGRIWTLSRPLTYRAIDGLIERGLVERHGTQTGRGRDRVLLAGTRAGTEAARSWLDEPVAHLRDVRIELLLKLALREREGLVLEPLLRAQQRLLAPTIERLIEHETDDLVDLWRRESARATLRFLREALDPRPAGTSRGRPDLRLSARNQLRATVDAVNHGDVMSIVKVSLPDGQRLTAAITKDAALDLDIAEGDDVIAITKSTEVMIAKPG